MTSQGVNMSQGAHFQYTYTSVFAEYAWLAWGLMLGLGVCMASIELGLMLGLGVYAWLA